MRLRVRMRLSERKTESTRRRQGLLIGGEEPQQLVLLARREQRGLRYRPLGARRCRASEGGHADLQMQEEGSEHRHVPVPVTQSVNDLGGIRREWHACER